MRLGPESLIETGTPGEFQWPLMANGAIADGPTPILASPGSGQATVQWMQWELGTPEAPFGDRTLTPRVLDLGASAVRGGGALEAVGRLRDDDGVLYAVGSRKDQP